MNMKRENELGDALERMGITEGDYCIVGGATLSKLGIRKNNDVDIVIREEFRALLGLDDGVISIGEEIEIVSKGWASIIGISDDDLIDSHSFNQNIDGYIHSKPELLFCLNLYRGREKDEYDNALILSEISAGMDWNWDLVRKILFDNNGTLKKFPLVRLNLVQELVHRAKTVAKLALGLLSFKLTAREAPPATIFRDRKTPMSYIIGYQYERGEFTRDDIFFRKIVADELIIGENNHVIDTYSKMQKIRANDDTITEFRELIQSFKKWGYLDEKPLLLNSRGRIGHETGAHRIATSIAMDIDEIPVRYNKTKERISYRINWFEDNGLAPDLIEAINNEKEVFFSNKGLITPIIIWPPASKIIEEIREELNCLCRVIGESKLEFRSFSNFKEFTEAVYSIDDVDDWKVQFKLSRFRAFRPEVYVFDCDLNPHGFRVKKSTGAPICTKIEWIKKTIREKFRHSIDDYTYDVICHIGDNFEHNVEIKKIISRHGGD